MRALAGGKPFRDGEDAVGDAVHEPPSGIVWLPIDDDVSDTALVGIGFGVLRKRIFKPCHLSL